MDSLDFTGVQVMEQAVSVSLESPPDVMDQVEPLYERPKAIARRFGLSPAHVYEAIYRGDLKVVRFRSRVLLIRPADADAWFESQIQSA